MVGGTAGVGPIASHRPAGESPRLQPIMSTIHITRLHTPDTTNQPQVGAASRGIGAQGIQYETCDVAAQQSRTRRDYVGDAGHRTS